jgi:hypothetical protein
VKCESQGNDDGKDDRLCVRDQTRYDIDNLPIKPEVWPRELRTKSIPEIADRDI